MKYSAEQIKDILKNAPNGSQFYTDGYDVKYRKVIGDKYFGYLDEAKGWVETCDKQLSQERIDKGWWLANLIKELENQMNIDNLATQTPEEKEALDLIDTTPHQYEMSKFSGNEWNGEGLPPVGVECELKYRHAKNANWRKCKVFAYSSEHGSAAAVWHLDGEIWHHHSINTSEYEFRKPETPEQKAERERLEAAYDLYVTAQKAVNNVKIVTYELFTFAETINLIYWLAIVDKTNYRKESN